MAVAYQLEISANVYEAARRLAKLDNVGVSTFVEDLILRHYEYVSSLGSINRGMAAYVLENYEMQRDPDEIDADYESRLSLFR
jgi:hypothetical protein